LGHAQLGYERFKKYLSILVIMRFGKNRKKSSQYSKVPLILHTKQLVRVIEHVNFTCPALSF